MQLIRSHELHIHPPGQASRSQVAVSILSPTQSAPPLDGAGLLHSLVLSTTPEPQVTEQSPSTNGDQLPSTVIIQKNNLR